MTQWSSEEVFPDYVAHHDKLAGAIHPLLDAPPVDIPGVTAGSLRKRLAAAKTPMPIVKCGALVDGYVLLHHVMGELEKEKGAWGYVEGGMGGVSRAIANSARSYGVDIFTEKNIFHGSVSLDQLYLARPLPSLSDYCSPIKGLYMCGSGAHPGGGVMGSPGWNAALTVMADMKRQ
ncbi:hypothetical protein ABVT39_010889 [Epinephelus coioides]